jgi:hypothetical protein
VLVALSAGDNPEIGNPGPTPGGLKLYALASVEVSVPTLTATSTALEYVMLAGGVRHVTDVPVT